MSFCRNLGSIISFCLYFFVGSNAYAMGGQECERFLQDRFRETLSHVDNIEDTRYEFSYVEEGHTWVGMIIKIAYVSDDNPITKNIYFGVEVNRLQELLLINFKSLMLESGAYSKVFDSELHNKNDVPIMTFDAAFDDVKDTYAISGSWDGLEFHFYRLYVVDNGVGGDPILMASVSDALAVIIEKCSSK